MTITRLAARAFSSHGSTDLPPFGISSLWTQFEIEPIAIALIVLPGIVYLCGVRRLRMNEVSWSGWRTGWFLTGLLILWIATSSAVGVYDTTLFSVHTVQHLLLQMIAPVPLAMGAPITLALRALPLAGRRRLMTVLHSRFMSVLSHPVFAYTVFAISPFALYYSPLFEETLRHPWVHNLSHVHFVVVGCLLFWIIVGVDPLPHRPNHLARMGMVMGLAPMHILLGVPIMTGTILLGRDYYEQLQLSWGAGALSDQQLGGALLWVFGDVTVLALMPAFIWQWVRSDQREARRVDRHLDRLGATATQPWWELTDHADARAAATRPAGGTESDRRS